MDDSPAVGEFVPGYEATSVYGLRWPQECARRDSAVDDAATDTRRQHTRPTARRWRPTAVLPLSISFWRARQAPLRASETRCGVRYLAARPAQSCVRTPLREGDA